jgi:hypothetical protein
MIQRFHGTLTGNGLSAICVVSIDSDGAEYLSDADVNPPLPDGEYDLEINRIRKRAVRTNGEWREAKISGDG